MRSIDMYGVFAQAYVKKTRTINNRDSRVLFMFDDNETSTLNLSLGAKIAILADLPLIGLGLFYLVTPITELRMTTGQVFACGSALNPPSDEFKSNICGPINTVYLYKGLIAIASGVLIAGLGFVFFGKTGSATQETVPVPQTETPKSESKRTRSFD